MKMPTRIHASPAPTERCANVASEPWLTTIATPSNESIMPSICRKLGRSPNSTNTQSKMIIGPADARISAFTAVVYCKPKYVMVLKDGTPLADNNSKNPQIRHKTGQSPLKNGQAKPTATMTAPVQRQNASVIGGTWPATARPMTMLPAQNRLANTSSVQADDQTRRAISTTADIAGARMPVVPAMGIT